MSKYANPFLREVYARYRDGHDPAHDILEGNGSSDEHFEMFHAISALGMREDRAHKLIELNKFLLFVFNCPFFLDGKIELPDEPEQDIKFTLPNGRTIGVELRDVYVERPGKPSMRQQEAYHDQIVTRAHELYKRRGGLPVCASFDFGSHTNYDRHDVLRMAERLSTMIPAAMASDTKLQFVERYNTNGPWPEGLVCATAHAPHWWQKNNPRWETDRGGNVYSSEEFVQYALDDKERKLKNYQQSNCDEYWLLLILPRLAPSSFMDAPDHRHVFKSSFDRAFFFELHGTKVTEITVANLSGSKVFTP